MASILKDHYGRDISYLRVSVTDRCNLRCRYCMPPHDLQTHSKKDILTFEEIIDVVQTSVDMGITKIRLTGGEPLLRKNVTTLVTSLAAIEGIRDLAMTTNGILLEHYARQLAQAGLHRVNISLDTVSPERFKSITRGGDISRVFAGIDAALAVGLTPVKINCVVDNSPDEADALAVKEYARRKNIEFRIIRTMNFKNGEFSVVENGTGGDCPRCNRLRLTSTGMIRPCLFFDQEFSIRDLGIKNAIRAAVNQKPPVGGTCTNNWMYTIGG